MKSFKTGLFMLLILTSLTLAIKAADEFDILNFFPAFSGKSKCNFASLKQIFSNYAGNAAALVDPADKILVTNYVSKYPEGGAPPTLTPNSQGGYDQIIPSRAAAFYLAGVEAVIQQNRVVAFWCFSEAAWRNPQSPIFLNNAAFALIEFGYLADALKLLQCANSLAPDFISPYINLGKVLGLLGRCAEAAEYFHNGFLKFPNNPHYLWRAANAYKCAGKLSKAWSLGDLGKLLAPGAYDWAGFLASLNYTPPIQPNDCGSSPSCQASITCANLAVKIQQYANEMYANESHYYQYVYEPAFNQLVAKRDAGMAPYANFFNNCKAQPEAIPSCCYHQWVVQVIPTLIEFDNGSRALDYAQYEFYLNNVQDYLSKAMADYQAALSSLTEEQASYLLCLINSHDKTAYFMNNRNLAIYLDTVNLQNDYRAPAETYKNCLVDAYASDPNPDPVQYAHDMSNVGYVEWVSTGHFTTSLEPKYCLTVFCFSYDAVSGNFGFEVSAGLAAKFTRNAFTGETAVNLGVGLKLGAGMSSIGSTAWVKLSPKQVGVEAQLNAGPAHVGYFYGAEHL